VEAIKEASGKILVWQKLRVLQKLHTQINLVKNVFIHSANVGEL
jgi:hypothetical protein